MCVGTYDATNLGQFLSDHFHIAYGTFYNHCECFYRKKFLTRPTPSVPAPFLGYFGVIWGYFGVNFGAQVSAHLRLSGLDVM